MSAILQRAKPRGGASALHRILRLSATSTSKSPLPLEHGAGYLASHKLPNGLGDLYLASAEPLSDATPGNGGLRLWHYDSDEKAKIEALGLGRGMAVKHDTYNTGFAGAKLICAASEPPSSWSPQDKTILLNEVATMLADLNGKMYTGCDMNTTTKDMDYLSERCLDNGGSDYVLAAIGNKACCPNTATAYGVFGAVEAAMGGNVAGKRLLVHGCGGVGSVVARLLVEHGADHVATVDVVSERASLDGCVNVSSEEEWWVGDYDAVVPCSSSGLLTEDFRLDAGVVVGATNLPFATDAAQDAAEARITFIPEGVSSAGAVIVDSVEHYSRDHFVDADPELLYEFTRETIRAKTFELLESAKEANVPPSKIVSDIAEPRTTDPIGRRFQAWAKFKSEENEAMRVADKHKADEIMARTMAAAAAEARASIIGRHASKAMKFHAQTPARPSPRRVAVDASALPGRVASPRRSTLSPGRAVLNANGRRSFASAAGASHWRSAQTLASSGTSAHTADAVVVGAGIMGLNIAYQLRRRDPHAKIVVLEQAPALGFGSSGYSTGFQRAYYSFDETMSFALDGMAAYKNWKDYLRDTDAEAKFTETGALWMLGYNQASNAAMVDRMARFGVGSEVVDADGLRGMFGGLISSEPMPEYNEAGDEVEQNLGAFSAVYEHGCGHLDSSTCLTDLLRACVRDGIDVRFNQKVGGVELADCGERSAGVRMADGSVISSGVVVNASGPWFNKLNATAGVDLSTTALPTRIQVGHKWIPDEFCKLPFVADGWGPSGIYFMPRAANNQLVFGSVDHRFESEIVDPDDYNTALDPDVKQDYLTCLFHRLPTLPRDGEIVGFSSMYTVNQDDVHPMIGETKVGGLWACNGFSGHGFKLAPAVGSLVAQQITGVRVGAWDTAVAHDFMGPYREPLTLKVKTHFA